MAKKDIQVTSRHDAEVEEKTSPLLSHLLELRNLLLHCVIAVLIGFVVGFYVLCTPTMNFIMTPIQARGVEVIYTAVSEALTTQFRVSFVLAVILASPYIIFCIWRFIKPALYDNEIRMTRMLFVLALFLFLLGIVFCYRYVYNLAIDFFLVAGEDLATPMLSIDKYVNFLFSFLLPFGIVFELPVALYIAARMGVVNYTQLAKFRKYVFFAIFIMAAILTPPDVISQVMLGVPMYVLYEIGVQVVRFTKPKPRGEKEDRAIEE
ncbi:MAG: twin-arginine translocase subunit TatC [Clostridia bacterium]|nr:twin-arginine translocase subunit TatC [Clostridia bacterium]MBR1685291.1 twin-arginine translocase subunit TatC [Clostridia bacterium]